MFQLKMLLLCMVILVIMHVSSKNVAVVTFGCLLFRNSYRVRTLLINSPIDPSNSISFRNFFGSPGISAQKALLALKYLEKRKCCVDLSRDEPPWDHKIGKSKHGYEPTLFCSVFHELNADWKLRFLAMDARVFPMVAPFFGSVGDEWCLPSWGG